MRVGVAKSLRWMRIVVAAAFLAGATGLFTAFGMEFPRFASWIARVQLLPAALAFAMGIFVAWIIATLLFGRIYCSTVCPMGAMQDVIARLNRSARRHGYRYTAPRNRLRYAFLAVTVAALVCGVSLVATLLDPYSAYGRICANILKPGWGVVCNMFTDGAPMKMAAASLGGLAIALLTLGVVAFVAARRGRLLCNTVCPVGTTLGLVSRFSIFHIDINTDKCIQCHKCEHACKSSCIDLTDHVVDMSRCVVCFDCLPVCPNDAISYTTTSHRLQMPLMMKIGTRSGEAATATNAPTEANKAAVRVDRRRFLAAGIVAATAPIAMKADKAARRVAATGRPDAVKAESALPVYPPGAPDRDYFLRHCTGCMLCVSHCPTGVLRPSSREYGVVNMFAPVMDFDRAACAYGCSRCNNLCPTGALMPLTKAQKQQTVIGRARVIIPNCIHCGACARACPREAIEMKGKPRLPAVDAARCIGCGACQHACPAYPYKAIIVDGLP